MRDICAVPTWVSDALHGGASLDNTAGRRGAKTWQVAGTAGVPERELESATDAMRRLAAAFGALRWSAYSRTE